MTIVSRNKILNKNGNTIQIGESTLCNFTATIGELEKHFNLSMGDTIKSKEGCFENIHGKWYMK